MKCASIPMWTRRLLCRNCGKAMWPICVPRCATFSTAQRFWRPSWAFPLPAPSVSLRCGSQYQMPVPDCLRRPSHYARSNPVLAFFLGFHCREWAPSIEQTQGMIQSRHRLVLFISGIDRDERGSLSGSLDLVAGLWVYSP